MALVRSSVLGPIPAAVPGEGVEPSRAEAHGCLRPARLPIPPSRPGPRSVPGRHPRFAHRPRLRLLALVVTSAIACTPETAAPGLRPDPGPPRAGAVAFLFDGSTRDADLVSGPALAGLELAAEEAGGLEIRPVNVAQEVDRVLAELRDVADDRGVAAAIVGPWTRPPAAAPRILASGGLPVLSLSWGWGPPVGETGPWITMAASLRDEASALLDAAPPTGTICLATDPHPMSGTLLRVTADVGRSGGRRLRPVGTVDARRPATAAAVAGRLARAGCRTLVWTGGAEAAAALVAASTDPPGLVASSRVKTDDGLQLAHEGPELTVTCTCADVTLTTETRLQRFVHDVQADSGSAPGAFAVEAYDAGRLVTALLRLGDGSRDALATRLAPLHGIPGIAGPYVLVPGRVSRFVASDTGVWRASGSRWLPLATGAA